MPRYFVVGPDGAEYGPADPPTLRAWAAHGRVYPQSVLKDAETGLSRFAEQVPGVFDGPATAPGPPGPTAESHPAPAPQPTPQPGPAPEATLQVLFAPTKMLIDAPVEVFVDGHKIGQGNFNQGVDLSCPVHPGRHTLDVRLALRSRRYTVDVDRPGRYLCQLSYSRLWGNFDKTVRLSYPGE